MKNIIFILLIIISPHSFAQKEIMTTNGEIHFEASVPYFEEVAATNKKAICILNIKTGKIKSTVDVKEFHFKLDLMEEHFNNKYIESNRYPEATFNGTIEGFNLYIIGNTPKEFKMKGELKIHGKSRKINTIVLLKKVEKGLEIESNFIIKASDFNIKIPEILSMKVAEKVTIKTFFWLQ